MQRNHQPTRRVVILTSAAFILLSLGLLRPPDHPAPEQTVSTREMLLDVALFQSATLSYSFLVTSTSFNSGVGSEILNNGSLSRGLGEFARFWRYESHYQVDNVDPNKTKKTFFWHPLLGFEYTNYLVARGYTGRRALLTSLLAIYVFEKGVQGSFETPSMYDFFSYASGITASLLMRAASRRLVGHHNPLLKGAGFILNPFLLAR